MKLEDTIGSKIMKIGFYGRRGSRPDNSQKHLLPLRAPRSDAQQLPAARIPRRTGKGSAPARPPERSSKSLEQPTLFCAAPKWPHSVQSVLFAVSDWKGRILLDPPIGSPKLQSPVILATFRGGRPAKSSRTSPRAKGRQAFKLRPNDLALGFLATKPKTRLCRVWDDADA